MVAILVNILGDMLEVTMNKEHTHIIVPVIMAVDTRTILYHLLAMINTVNQEVVLVNTAGSYIPMIPSGMVKTVLEMRLPVVHHLKCHGLSRH